jgi:hypothetical protein
MKVSEETVLEVFASWVGVVTKITRMSGMQKVRTKSLQKNTQHSTFNFNFQGMFKREIFNIQGGRTLHIPMGRTSIQSQGYSKIKVHGILLTE